MKLAIAATAAVAALVLGGLFLVLFTTVVPTAAACVPAQQTAVAGGGGFEAAAEIAARENVGFAIVDDRGALLGEASPQRTGRSASVSKALVLVALLRMAEQRALTSGERSAVGRMVRDSDNAAANQLYARVGPTRVDEAARAAGMSEWQRVVRRQTAAGYDLGYSRVSPLDLARLFATLDATVPDRHREFALAELGAVRGAGRFGVLSVPAFSSVPSKAGWRPEDEGGWTVAQGARLTLDGREVGVGFHVAGAASKDAAASAIAAVADALSQSAAETTAVAAAPVAFRTLQSGGAVGDIPAAYAVLYQQAAAKYRLGEWATLAAVGSIETDHGRSPLPGVKSGTNSAGAAGPMQFIASTWAAYGVDGNGDGRRNIYDPQDAIPGAANYLRASGAPGNWQKALFAYNHAQWYVDDVLERAREYRALGAGAVAAGDAGMQLASCAAAAETMAAGTSSEVGARIVEVARGEIGNREQPMGSNCTKYNAPQCYAWCSAFTTWVWQKAGVRVPIIPCSGNVLGWAAANGGRKLGPNETPAPGDAIVYGTGPTCPASVHIGLVEQVFPDGRIATIEGNGSDNAVSRKAPFFPARAQASGRPGPVYGYARPPGTDSSSTEVRT